MTRRRLTCTHCGSSAGHFEQHWNHDTGYGVCRPCLEWVTQREDLTPEQIKSNYGTEGINYAAARSQGAPT